MATKLADKELAAVIENQLGSWRYMVHLLARLHEEGYEVVPIQPGRASLPAPGGVLYRLRRRIF